MPNVAVLTNDLQYGLLEDFITKVENGRKIIAQAIPPFAQFLDAIRSLGHVVAHCQLIHDADDPQVQRRYRNVSNGIPVIRGTPGTALIQEFVHPADVIVEKSRDSGFYDTVLDDRLQDLGVKTVLVTGISTQICVQTTAADAFFRGYKVWVPEDCVFSLTEEDKVRSLEWMKSYCAVVSSAAEILERLQADDDLPAREELLATAAAARVA
jgi:nicotinamidase-related amidase